MRRQYHKTSASNLYASKRIAVALCAAIAMVLGAMSVGATRHLNSPLDGDVTTEDNNNPLLANRTTGSDSTTPNSTPLNGSFMSQQPLTVTPVSKPTPLLVNPKSQQLDVRLGPIQTLVDKEKLELELNVQQVIPVVPTVDASVTINVPETTGTVTDTISNIVQDSPLATQDTSSPNPPANEQPTP
jgi:hypothetical protein